MLFTFRIGLHTSVDVSRKSSIDISWGINETREAFIDAPMNLEFYQVDDINHQNTFSILFLILDIDGSMEAILYKAL